MGTTSRRRTTEQPQPHRKNTSEATSTPKKRFEPLYRFFKNCLYTFLNLTDLKKLQNGQVKKFFITNEKKAIAIHTNTHT